ncbi:MAG: CPBP family intramembrane glutamate endopeptidase, partial [Lutimonas sp.]
MRYLEQVFKGKNDWWRYLLSLITVFFGWQVVGVIPIFFVALNKSENLDELMASSESMFMDLGIDSNMYLLVMLLSFVFGLIFLLISVKRIHHRSIVSLVTSREKIDWKRVGYGFAIWFLFSILSIAVDYVISPEHYVFNFKPEPFAILLLISVIFMPLQTS